MITNNVVLPRLLPGLFTLRPTVSSAGYTMPRERFFVYGIGFSALLHAAILLGVNPPKPPVAVSIRLDEPVPRVWRELSLAEETPPPAPTPSHANPTKADDPGAEASGLTRASIPDHIFDIEPGAIVMTGVFDRGVEPDAKRLSWTVPPANPAVNRNGVPLIDEKDLDNKPVPTTRVAPNYPGEAKRLGLSGTVVLRFIVDHRGNVADVEVVSAEHTEFVRAAAEAMLRWRFTPGRKNGRPVGTRMEMPMKFALETSS